MEIITYQSYHEYKTELDTELRKSAEGFVKIGYLLKLARDTDILNGSGYANVNDFAKAEYGIDKTMVSRFISINDRFSEGGNTPQLKERYRGFGYAKLTIMLQLPDAINEEISPAFSKTEVQAIKEEYDEERKKTDLEVMMEGSLLAGVPEEENLEKVIWQIGHDNPELYLNIHEAMQTGTAESLQEALAPAGESIYSTRLQGVGRLMLSVKGTDRDVTLTNIRTNEKESCSWEELKIAMKRITDVSVSGKDSWESIYEEEFPVKEEPKKPEVAPVQPIKEDKPKQKKPSKVTKAGKKPEKTKPEPDLEVQGVRENPEGQQDTERVENMTGTVEIVSAPPEIVSGTVEPVNDEAVIVPKCDREPMTEQEYEKRYWNYMDMIVANISDAQAKLRKKAFGLARDDLEETVKLLNELISLENYYGKEDHEDD